MRPRRTVRRPQWLPRWLPWTLRRHRCRQRHCRKRISRLYVFCARHDRRWHRTGEITWTALDVA